MTEQGIDSEDIDIDIDIDIARDSSNRHSIVLKTPFFGGPDDSQITALKEALQAIIETKDTALEVTFTLRPDQMSDISPSEREEIEALEQEYTVALEVEEPVILVDYGIQDGLRTAFSQDGTIHSDARCSMAMTVEPALPFRKLTIRSKSEEAFEHMFVKKLNTSNSLREIPVEITTGNQKLLEALESNEVAMLVNIREEYINPIRQHFEGRDDSQQLELDLGSMGTIRHEYGAVNRPQMWGLEEKCTNIAVTYGRPFTYKYGESLDRLESVSFN